MNKLLMLTIYMCLVSSAALAGDGAGTENKAVAPLAEFVAPADSLPHLRYLADGKITLNKRCPVRKVALNPLMGASYVNGQPVGFC